MHLRMRRLSSSQVCLATHIMRTTHTHSVHSQHTPTRQRSTQSHGHTHTHAHTYTQIYTYTYTHIHGHTYIHTHMHAHIPCIYQEVDRFLSLLHPTLKIWCGPWNLVHTKFEMWYASVSSDLIEMIYSTILQLSQAAHATYYGLVDLQHRGQEGAGLCVCVQIHSMCICMYTNRQCTNICIQSRHIKSRNEWTVRKQK